MPNRETRRRNAKQQQPAAPTLEQLAALPPQIPPLIINLDNCRVIVQDIEGATDGSKQLLFVHVTGGVVFRALISPTLRRELATLLSAPTGLVIPNADTPAA